MANFKISSKKTTDEQGKGTLENPFKLNFTRDSNDVTSINLNNSAIHLEGMGVPVLSWLENVTNGTNTITNGDLMFRGQSQLKTFICDMPNLTSATEMFSGCSRLQTFVSKMPSLDFDSTKAHLFGKNAPDVDIEVNSSWSNVKPMDIELIYGDKPDEWDSKTILPNGNIRLQWSKNSTVQ